MCIQYTRECLAHLPNRVTNIAAYGGVTISIFKVIVLRLKCDSDICNVGGVRCQPSFKAL